MKSVDAWPVWEFECPHCHEIVQVNDDYFGGDDSATMRCEICDNPEEFIVYRGDVSITWG